MVACALLLLALVPAATPLSVERDAVHPPRVPHALALRFTGNRVLAQEVYRAVLHLAPGARPDAATAQVVEDQLEALLRRSGYDLAKVSAEAVAGEYVAVHIDEGQLEKVVFTGKLTLKTLRFKLALNIPDDVFNRPALERQLKALAAKLGTPPVHYELVPSREVTDDRPQMESLGPLNNIQGYQVLHPQHAYELHISFDRKPWNTGVALDLRTSNVDGLEVIVSGQGKDLLGRGDRYRLAASGGAGLRSRIDGGGLYPTFSRAYAEALYYAPVPVVRPLLEVRGEWVSRQRADLGLENYDQLQVDALLNLDYEFAPKQNLVLGVGERHIRLFDFKEAKTVAVPPGIGNLTLYRPFAELRFNYLFDDGGQRWDRRHALTLEARHFFADKTVNMFGEAHLAWQKVFSIGWDDLWLRVHGAYLWGAVPFPNEEPVSGVHLRNVFDRLYVHRVASESTEYRFSITRDIFKVSVFNDAAAFGVLQRTPGAPEQLAFGDCVGVGVHALIEGMFQLNVYYGFGFDTVAPHFDQGFSLSLQKVF